MRVLKTVGLLAAGAMLLLGVAAGALAIGGDPLIAKLIATQGSALLGRRIRFEHLEIHWGRPILVRAQDIRIGNADWGSRPDMLAGRRLEMEVDPGALLRMRLVIPRLVLEEPAVLLETSTRGEHNWEGVLGGATASGTHAAIPPIRRLRIRHGHVVYRNGQTEAQTDLWMDDLVAKAPPPTGDIEIAANGTLDEQPFAFTAALGALARLQDGGEPYPVKLDGRLGVNNVTVTGVIAEPVALQGLSLRVDMNGQDIQRLLATLGVPIPRMPIYHLAGRLRRDGERWLIEEISGRVGGSELAGRILIDTPAGPGVPYIRAELTAAYLDLADLAGLYRGDPKRPPPAKRGKPKDRRVIPEVQPPLEKMLGLNADLSLDAPWIKPAAGLPFERVTFRLSLKDGTLRLNPARVAIAGGEVLADLEYRSADTPPRVRADLDLRRVDLHELLAGIVASPDLKRTAGSLGGFVKLRSAGTTQRQMLADLRGDVGLFLQNGQLSQLAGGIVESDVAEMLGLAADSNRPHPVNCLIARFAVEAGVATATTLLLDTTETVVAGEGNVNLGDETLFLDLRPYPKDGSSRRVGAPLRIRGTFATPTVTSDKAGLLARLGAAIGFGVVSAPADLLPLIRAGLGEQNECGEVFAAQPPPGGAQGSSTPPRRRAR